MQGLDFSESTHVETSRQPSLERVASVVFSDSAAGALPSEFRGRWVPRSPCPCAGRLHAITGGSEPCSSAPSLMRCLKAPSLAMIVARVRGAFRTDLRVRSSPQGVPFALPLRWSLAPDHRMYLDPAPRHHRSCAVWKPLSPR